MSSRATDCVHAGERPGPHGEVNTPIARSTTYRYPEAADGGQASHIYSRYDNPSVQAAEAKIAALDGADHCLLTASGMAAIVAITHTLEAGSTIAVQQGVYGGTTAYLNDEAARFGINVVSFDADGPVPPADLVWIESVTNPLLSVADIPRIANEAHDHGGRLVVDATFATPILQRPLDLGADLVIHSATKYLGGHSDITAGAITFNGPPDELWRIRRNLGATLDPDAAYLLSRGLKTLDLRVRRQAATALQLAQRLADDGVTVHHPGLPSHPHHAVAKRLLPDGCTGMLTLDLGSKNAAIAFRRNSGIITPAASLGGVESLVSLPLETSHAYMADDQRRAIGVSDGLVRLSIGIEDPDDLYQAIRAGIDAGQQP